MEVLPLISTLKILSPAFMNRSLIPVKYTCEGENINPPLKFTNIPEETKSIVLLLDDPDAPQKTWNHWVVWNIPPTDQIAEDSVPGQEGVNSYGNQNYDGPCPPFGTHRYYFKVYALDTMLKLDSQSGKQAVLMAMKHHIIAEGKIMGLYKRTK